MEPIRYTAAGKVGTTRASFPLAPLDGSYCLQNQRHQTRRVPRGKIRYNIDPEKRSLPLKRR